MGLRFPKIKFLRVALKRSTGLGLLLVVACCSPVDAFAIGRAVVQCLLTLESQRETPLDWLAEDMVRKSLGFSALSENDRAFQRMDDFISEHLSNSTALVAEHGNKSLSAHGIGLSSADKFHAPRVLITTHLTPELEEETLRYLKKVPELAKVPLIAIVSESYPLKNPELLSRVDHLHLSGEGNVTFQLDVEEIHLGGGHLTECLNLTIEHLLGDYNMRLRRIVIHSQITYDSSISTKSGPSDPRLITKRASKHAREAVVRSLSHLPTGTLVHHSPTENGSPDWNDSYTVITALNYPTVEIRIVP